MRALGIALLGLAALARHTRAQEIAPSAQAPAAPARTPVSVGASQTPDTPSSEPLPNVPQAAPSADGIGAAPTQSSDETRAFSYARYKAEVEALVQRFPGRVRVLNLGASRQGRDLLLVVASDERERDAATKPALVLCPDLDAPDGGASGARSLIDTVQRLLARAASEPRVDALLHDTALYFAPALDPDRAFGETGARAAERAGHTRLAADFPIDWTPRRDRPELFTPYPLSEPESRAMAEFLRARSNVSGVLVLASRPRVARSRDEIEDDLGGATLAPRVQRELIGRALDASAGRPLVRAYRDLQPGAGSLEAYCDGRLGQFVFVCEPWIAASASVEPAADIDALSQAAIDLAAGLPHLACDPPTVERLRANLWLVDVSLYNAGLLPTAAPSAAVGSAALRVRLRTSGVRVATCAVRRGARGFETLSGAHDAWLLGHLAGGDSVTVRLVVEAQENGVLEIAFDAPRAGDRRITVPLL